MRTDFRQHSPSSSYVQFCKMVVTKFLSVSSPTFSVSFVMSGPPCLGLGAGPSGATPVIACVRAAHLNLSPWTCGLSLSKDARRSCSDYDDALTTRPSSAA
jgi:hypothetical protein